MAVVSLFLFVPGPARSAIRSALVRHCSVCTYPLPSRTRICAGGPSTHVALRVPPPTPQILVRNGNISFLFNWVSIFIIGQWCLVSLSLSLSLYLFLTIFLILRNSTFKLLTTYFLCFFTVFFSFFLFASTKLETFYLTFSRICAAF